MNMGEIRLGILAIEEYLGEIDKQEKRYSNGKIDAKTLTAAINHNLAQLLHGKYGNALHKLMPAVYHSNLIAEYSTLDSKIRGSQTTLTEARNTVKMVRNFVAKIKDDMHPQDVKKPSAKRTQSKPNKQIIDTVAALYKDLEITTTNLIKKTQIQDFIGTRESFEQVQAKADAFLKEVRSKLGWDKTQKIAQLIDLDGIKSKASDGIFNSIAKKAKKTRIIAGDIASLLVGIKKELKKSGVNTD